MTCYVTERHNINEAKRRRLKTQWGVVSLYEWMRLEADRLTRAGRPARRRTLFDLCWIEADEDRSWAGSVWR